MKQIAFTGGKGGTGKSVVSCLWAIEKVKRSKKVILTDCDVECPNNYLLLAEKLKKPIKKIHSPCPKLDKRKCRKCGLCVKKCKENAIFQPPGDYPQFLEEFCSSCGACWNICPYGAIKTEEKGVGKIYENKIEIKNGGILTLITGVSASGAQETGPISRETRKFAEDKAKREMADFLVVDTAAGIHCPVIGALENSQNAFIVAEPTPMGGQDLEIIINLLKKLKIRSQIIINKSDLGDKSLIEKIAKKYKINIGGNIPYSKKIEQRYLEGKIKDLNGSIYINKI